MVVFSTERGKPFGGTPHDCWAYGDGFDVCDGCWATVEAGVSGERGFKAGFAGFAFEAFEEALV